MRRTFDFWRFSWGSCIYTIVGSHAVVFLSVSTQSHLLKTWILSEEHRQHGVRGLTKMRHSTSVWEVKTCAKPVVDPFLYILYITVIYIICIIVHVSPFLGVENTCVHHLCCALLKIGGNLWGTFWFCFGVTCASSMNHKNSQELQKKAFIQCSMNLLRHCY